MVLDSKGYPRFVVTLPQLFQLEKILYVIWDGSAEPPTASIPVYQLLLVAIAVIICNSDSERLCKEEEKPLRVLKRFSLFPHVDFSGKTICLSNVIVRQ